MASSMPAARGQPGADSDSDRIGDEGGSPRGRPRIAGETGLAHRADHLWRRECLSTGREVEDLHDLAAVSPRATCAACCSRPSSVRCAPRANHGPAPIRTADLLARHRTSPARCAARPASPWSSRSRCAPGAASLSTSRRTTASRCSAQSGRAWMSEPIAADPLSETGQLRVDEPGGGAFPAGCGLVAGRRECRCASGRRASARSRRHRHSSRRCGSSSRLACATGSTAFFSAAGRAARVGTLAGPLVGEAGGARPVGDRP